VNEEANRYCSRERSPDLTPAPFKRTTLLSMKESGKKGEFGFVETLVIVDVLGCFAPATAASPGAISLKNRCTIFLSLKVYAGFQQSREFNFPG